MNRYIRFEHGGAPRWAMLKDGAAELLEQAPWLGLKPSGERMEAKGLPLLAPAEPSKILCVGLNYKDHAAEMDDKLPEEPLLFMKPPSALNRPGGPIRLPRMSQRVDYEAELAFVIGLGGAIFGYTCANDVTARDLQKKDGQWTRAKGFDGFCPLGPELAEGLNPSALQVECRVNGELRQSGNTAQQIFGPGRILAFVSEVMTLLPGDVVLTGTPAGIGPLKSGDSVEVRVSGLEPLINPVI